MAGFEDMGARQVYAVWQDCYERWARLLERNDSSARRLDPAAIYRHLVAPHFGPAASPLSLIIPAYRESHRIERSIALVARFLDEFPLNMEVIYVVERSPDCTLELASKAAAGHQQIKIHDNQVQKGKGYAVRSGVQMASGEVIFYNDTDLSVPLHQMLYFLAVMEQNPSLDMLIGERVRLTCRTFYRRSLSLMFKQTIGLFSHLPWHWDTQCGFKAFRRDVAKHLFSLQSVRGFAFDLELLLLGRRLGMHIGSQKVAWLNDERSTVNPVLECSRMVAELLALRRNLERTLPEALALRRLEDRDGSHATL